MIDLRLKYGTNNIPILSNETIDEHAELLIGDYDSSLLSKLTCSPKTSPDRELEIW